MSQILFESAWLIPCYPLIGAIASVIWFPSLTRLTGPRPAGYVNLITTLFAFLHGAIALFQSLEQPALKFSWQWLQVADLNLSCPIEISALTIGAMVLVTGLNLLAQVYAIGYMEMDWGWARFFALLAFFEAGMCALVLCNSLFFAYIILEILTLGTYLLVGFWFNQSLVVSGARDAFLTKRVGDLVLLMGVVALLPLAGTWDFDQLVIWAENTNIDPNLITLVSLALIAGPMGKCAQFPLHLWLDEAMEAPIPSTILRASVVVPTGAWILIKLAPVLALSPTAMSALIAIGAITSLGGALIAIAQIDVKRTLSYAVSSYMGLVFIAVGTGQTDAALLLVLVYAVAIALLYMAVGAVILNSTTQNVTQLGGLWSRRPISGLGLLIGAAGLVAFPPLGGFWAFLKLGNGLWTDYPWLVGFILVVNGLTAFSLSRVFCLIFGGSAKEMAQRSPEVNQFVILPLVTLSGFVLHLPLVLQSLNFLPLWVNLNKDVALLLIWSTIFGFSIGAVTYLSNSIPKPIRFPWKGLQDLLANDFYTPKIYRQTIVFTVAVISQIAFWVDRYIFDALGNLFGLIAIFSGEVLKYSTFGKAQAYLLTTVIGIGIILLMNF
ncbi:NAD(P)H dehydrogenase, subunit NdhF3 family [Synechococcus sp. PCC 7502]|uniref:NAD(P)H-quinone oxidoreductase subunit F n=1 Tax=Synechococcus sp. PCC 7502 TaxID=1173263 RepID=UPI00029FF8B4|nr:NAD(P)H-quinone oxidoreductase subunit F [Synechococcus sp. PCC 7502]AFY74422.1 NAD(P)H dehydrogenase, subunit NdhF3 family [Synechococcus sp. PCC 7502]